MTSSSDIPPLVDGLPKRPAVSNSHPPIHNKPRSICRNFVYRGVCVDRACPRAHVPYNDMVDLLAYLMERDDCPPELRSITRRLTRPDSSRCRKQCPSDRICPYFLQGSCRLHDRCPRAHLRSFHIYHSLLQPAKVPDQAKEGSAPRPESELPPATSIDPTTSTDVPILAADET